MDQSSLLKAAKQGDPQAIATLFNRSFSPKGITAKTKVADGCLQIVLEAEGTPPEAALVSYIWNAMTKLGAPSIQKIKIYGRQAGDEFPAWHQDINLQNNQSNRETPGVSSSQPGPLPSQPTMVVYQQDQKTVKEPEPEPSLSCPKCRSTHVTANKKGFNIGQALVGGLVTGGVGLAAGLWGSNEIRLNCLKCGHRWKPK